MSQIGKLSANGSDELTGYIATLTLNAEIVCVSTGKAGSGNMPSHRIFARKANDQDVEIGAAWEKVTRDSTNEEMRFLSINLDDPSFANPINVAAFPTRNPGEYAITWRRRQDRNAGSGR